MTTRIEAIVNVYHHRDSEPKMKYGIIVGEQIVALSSNLESAERIAKCLSACANLSDFEIDKLIAPLHETKDSARKRWRWLDDAKNFFWRESEINEKHISDEDRMMIRDEIGMKMIRREVLEAFSGYESRLSSTEAELNKLRERSST